MILVKALRNFMVCGDVVVLKGSIHEVNLTPSGYFWTTTRSGTAFGTCNLSDGWKVIQKTSVESDWTFVGCIPGPTHKCVYCQ